MNPVLVLLIIIGVVILWFLLSFAFYPLGKLIHRIWKDACDEMNREDKNNKEEKEKTK